MIMRDTSPPKPLSRKLAISLALAGMWLLACLGVFVAIHSIQWWFIGIHGHDAATVGQIGAFFMVWTAAQLPAASIAGLIIGSSDFTHPLRTTLWVMAGYHLFFSAIRAIHWPWTAFHDLDQSIPILANLVSILLLIGVSVFFAWLMPRWHRIFQRFFTH